MTSDRYPLAATIILLLPMIYFLFTSLTFFLGKFSDPVVTRLLRGLFSTYFIALIAGSLLATLAFATSARPGSAAELALMAALAIAARHWFLHRLDIQIRARDAGEPQAIARLRRLQLGGILYNAIHTFIVIASIPQLLPQA